MRILRNDGISVVALVIILLLLSTLGISLVSLIITKQKSALLPLKSTQAFYVAQAGIEYAIRYAANDPNFDPDVSFSVTESLGAGSFSVTYDEVNRSITSTGTAGTAKRVITLASFPVYVAGGVITLDPGNAPYTAPVLPALPGGPVLPALPVIPLLIFNVCVPTLNNYDCDVYIFQIDLAKEGGTKAARLNKMEIGGTVVWTGNKVDVSTDPDSPTTFPFDQYTMAPGAALDKIEVQATAEVSGTWHLTFHYSRQTDLSDPETSTITFIIS